MDISKYLNPEGGTENNIIMYDEDNNEIVYNVFAIKEQDGIYYMLAETTSLGNDEPESEVYIFRCIAENELSDEMVFEMVDEGHESFDLAFSLFENEFDKYGVEY